MTFNAKASVGHINVNVISGINESVMYTEYITGRTIWKLEEVPPSDICAETEMRGFARERELRIQRH